MGATKGYHPVSLHVIRGAAEYLGYKFGKIKKIAEFPETQKAIYAVWIEKAPRGAGDWSPKFYQKQLQHCFADDITVTSVRLSTEAPAIAVLKVQLDPTPMDEFLEGGRDAE